MIKGYIGLVVNIGCLETLVETIKIVIVDMVVDYKVLVNFNVCDRNQNLVKVTVERAHEDAIVQGNVIILPNGEEEIPVDIVNVTCDCEAYYSLPKGVRNSYKLVRFNPCPIQHSPPKCKSQKSDNVEQIMDNSSDDDVIWYHTEHAGSQTNVKKNKLSRKRTKPNSKGTRDVPLQMAPIGKFGFDSVKSKRPIRKVCHISNALFHVYCGDEAFRFCDVDLRLLSATFNHPH